MTSYKTALLLFLLLMFSLLVGRWHVSVSAETNVPIATLVKNFNTRTKDANPSNFVESAGLIYFTATQNGASGIWRSEGETAVQVLYFS